MNHNNDGSSEGLSPNPKSQVQWMVQGLDPRYHAGSIRYKCRQPSHTTATNDNNKHGPSWLCILTIAGLVKCTSRPRGSKREAEKAAAAMVLYRWDDIALHLMEQVQSNAMPSTLVYREGEPEPHTPPPQQQPRTRRKHVWRTDASPVSSEDASPAMWDGASWSDWQESDADGDSSSSSSSDDASDRQDGPHQQRRQRRKQRQSTQATTSEHNGHGTSKPPAMNLEQAFQSLAQAQRNLLQATENANTAFRVACLTLRQTVQQQRQQGSLCDFDV